MSTEKIPLFGLKFKAYVAIAWGLIVAFIIVGGMMGKQVAPIAAALVAVMWTMLRILHEAFDAYDVLKVVRALEKEAARKDDDEDDPPEDPTAFA